MPGRRAALRRAGQRHPVVVRQRPGRHPRRAAARARGHARARPPAARVMKFGIFYEHQLPRPWGRAQRVPAAAGFADPDRARRPPRLRLRLGGRAPLPRGVLALLGARGVPRRRQPAHQAHPARPRHHPAPHQPPDPRGRARGHARSAVAAAASSSGWARGRARSSCIPFGRRVRDKREVWEEAVRALVPVFTRSAWECHGQYFDFPARNVMPKPFQKPHPPLWVACSNIQTIASAGAWGMGALGFQFVSPEAARAWVHRYYTNLTQNLDQARRLSGQSQHRHGERLHVRADRRGGAGEGRGLDVLRLLPRATTAATASPTPGEGNMWEAYQEWRHTPEGAGDAAQRAHRLAGDDPPAAARVRGRRRRPGDPARTRPDARSHEDICTSLELFAREVMPEFHAREPEHAALEGRRAGRPRSMLEDARHRRLQASTPTRTRTSSGSRPSSSSRRWRPRKRGDPHEPAHATDLPGGPPPGAGGGGIPRGARPRGLPPRSGRGQVRPRERALPDRPQLPRGRGPGARGHDGRPLSRAARRRRRLHGDHPVRRSGPAAQALRGGRGAHRQRDRLSRVPRAAAPPARRGCRDAVLRLAARRA